MAEGNCHPQLYLKMWTPSWRSGEPRNGVGAGAARCKVKVFPDTGISSLWKQSKRKFSLWVKRRILSIALKPLGSLRSGRAWKAAQKFRPFSHETGISSAEGVSWWDLWSLYELWLANDEVGETPTLCFLNLIQCVRNSEEKKMNLFAAERDSKVPTTAQAHASSPDNFSYRQKLKRQWCLWFGSYKLGPMSTVWFYGISCFSFYQLSLKNCFSVCFKDLVSVSLNNCHNML